MTWRQRLRWWRYRHRWYRVEGHAHGGVYLYDLDRGGEQLLVATPDADSYRVGEAVQLDYRRSWYCAGVKR